MSDQKKINPSDDGDLFTDVAGSRQWKRSKLGWLTGVGAVTDAVRDVGRLGGESRERVSGLFGALRQGDTRGRKVEGATAGGSDLFEKAAAVNGKTDANIAFSVSNTYRQFWLYAAMFLGAVLFAVVPLFVFGFSFPALWPIELAFRTMLIPLTGALALRAAYTNWVFRRRSMDGMGDFIRSREFLPKKSGVMRKTSRSIVTAAVVAIGFLFAGLTGEAVAQNGSANLQTPQNLAQEFFSDPQEGDLFTYLLSYIVPDVGPIQANEDTANAPQYAAIKAGFFFFSATLMFVGANLVGWQIISSIVASAKEGSMMGRRYHEVWAPIRAVVGFGMLAPIAGGFCAAQVVVIYLVVWGGNLANLVWAPYIERITISSNENMQTRAVESIHRMGTQSAMQTAEQVLTKGICNETLNAYHQRNGTTSNTGTYVTFPQDGPEFQKVDAVREVSAASRWSGSGSGEWIPFRGWSGELRRHEVNYGSVCGTLFVQFNDRNLDYRSDGEAETANAIMGEAQVEATQRMMKALHQSVIVPVAQSYQSYGSGTASRLLSNDTALETREQIMRNLRVALVEYDAVMLSAASQVYDQANAYEGSTGAVEQLRRDAIQQGWAGAGMFYGTLARLQNRIYERATQAVQSTPLNVSSDSNSSDDINRILFGTAGNQNGAISQLQTFWRNTQYSVAANVSDRGMTVANETTEFGEFLSMAFGPLLTWFDHDTNPHILNPMQDMVDAGNKMLGAGIGGFVFAKTIENGSTFAATAAGAATGGVAGATAGALMTTVLSSLAGPFAALTVIFSIILMAAGIVHAFIIPMIPYIMTVFFVASMLVLVVEALVAAPIWAFLHIRLDGDEFVDQVQKPGYMIAFNLILRPTLMIFGLILSMLIFGAMVAFVTLTFTPAMQGLSATNGIGLIGFIVLAVLTVYLHFQTAVRAFTLILRLPDRVVRWFGQGGENLGEEQDYEKTTGVIVGNMERRVEGAGAGFGQRRTGIPAKGAKALASGATGGGAGAAAGAAGAAKAGGGGGGSGSTGGNISHSPGKDE